MRIAERQQVECEGQSSSNWISFTTSKKTWQWQGCAALRSAGAAWENLPRDVHGGNIKEPTHSFVLHVKLLGALCYCSLWWKSGPHVVVKRVTAPFSPGTTMNFFYLNCIDLQQLSSTCWLLCIYLLRHLLPQEPEHKYFHSSSSSFFSLASFTPPPPPPHFCLLDTPLLCVALTPLSNFLVSSTALPLSTLPASHQGSGEKLWRWNKLWIVFIGSHTCSELRCREWWKQKQ